VSIMGLTRCYKTSFFTFIHISGPTKAGFVNT